MERLVPGGNCAIMAAAPAGGAGRYSCGDTGTIVRTQ